MADSSPPVAIPDTGAQVLLSQDQGEAPNQDGPPAQDAPTNPETPPKQDNGPKYPPLKASDLRNIQGDIILGLPKKAQRFFFFKIKKVEEFRKDLRRLVPLITTCAQTHENRQAIRNRYRKDDCLHMGSVNIAFTWVGLKEIDKEKFKNGTTGDKIFEEGMGNDPRTLRDNPENWKPENWEPKKWAGFLDQKEENPKPFGFNDKEKTIHGVVLVVGEDCDRVMLEWKKVENIIGQDIEKVLVLDGKVRPDAEAGHEHFGYLDGVSQPFVIGTENLRGRQQDAFPGQGKINPGVILCGRDGDNLESSDPRVDTSKLGIQPRQTWQTDGSFLAFRYLRQKVPEFNRDLAKFAGAQNTDKTLLGARMVGRWKSGAPLDIAPFQDDRGLAKDPLENNNFQFEDNDNRPENPHSRCPFSAHIRKTHPRGDLKPGPMSMERVLRRGIPYGPEITDEEKQDEEQKSAHDRGLLFVCYQSHLSRGFQLMQSTWANNPGFIFGKTPNPGIDPIIGQTHPGPETANPAQPKTDRTATGLISANSEHPTNLNAFNFGKAEQEWVESRGGEYFFSPSISSLLNFIAM